MSGANFTVGYLTDFSSNYMDIGLCLETILKNKVIVR